MATEYTGNTWMAVIGHGEDDLRALPERDRRQWIHDAVREARAMGLTDPRSDEEIVEDLLQQAGGGT